MSRPLSVAFQGGGARFISLIAAAHGLWDLKNNNRIDIKAVSGSSAGSIAAFLLAADVDFDQVQRTIRNHAGLIKKEFPPISQFGKLARAAQFYLHGKPFYKKAAFEIIASKILDDLNIDVHRPLNSFAIIPSLYIMISDIYQSRSIPASNTTRLLEALWTSCSIPVAFSSYADGSRGLDADGGVFNNLPTDILLSEDRGDGPVFAIGFPPAAPAVARSSTDYLMALIASVMAHREAHSRSLVGEDYVFPVETALTTFSFDQIATVGLDEYDSIRGRAREFFNSWLSGAKPRDSQDTNHPRANLRLRHIEDRLVEFAETSWVRAARKLAYIKLTVHAHCLANADRADEIETEQLVELRDGTVPIGVSLPFLHGAGEHLETHCEMRWDGPDGRRIAFQQFIVERPHLVGAEKTLRNTVVLLIEDDLSDYKSNRIFVLKKELRYGFMAPLRDRGEDSLAVGSRFLNADEAFIHCNVPNEFGAVEHEWSAIGEAAPPVPVEVDFRDRPMSARALCARATAVPHKSSIKLRLIKKDFAAARRTR